LRLWKLKARARGTLTAVLNQTGSVATKSVRLALESASADPKSGYPA
jgi:hypothetical protein